MSDRDRHQFQQVAPAEVSVAREVDEDSGSAESAVDSHATSTSDGYEPEPPEDPTPGESEIEDTGIPEIQPELEPEVEEEPEPEPGDVYGEVQNPDRPIPRRPPSPQRESIAKLQGRLTKYAGADSGLSWIRPFVRTENINLHTTFGRRARLLPTKLSGWLIFALAVAVSTVLFLFGRSALGLALVLTIGLLLLLADLNRRLPDSGYRKQWVRQKIGANSWILDIYYAAQQNRLGLGIAGAVALAVLVALVWLLDRLGFWMLANLSSLLLAPLLLWLIFVWLDRKGRAQGRRRVPALPDQVRRLSMVQALSWTIMRRYPGERKNPELPNFFVSSFNESFDGYVGGFVEGMEQALDGPWGLTPGFPKVADGFRPFLEYVDMTSFPLEHSFFAYPHTSVVDVRSALQVERLFRSLRIEIGNEELTRGRFQQFLSQARMALPAIPQIAGLEPDGPQLEIAPFAGDLLPDPGTVNRAMPGSARIRSTILVSPLALEVASGEDPKSVVDEVRGFIQDLPGGFPEKSGVYAHADSPFGQVPGTHIARLTVVAPWQDPRPKDRRAMYFEALPKGETDIEALQPKHPWLFFSAQFDTELTIGGDGAIDSTAGIIQWLERAYDAIESAHPGSVEAIWGRAFHLLHGKPDVSSRNGFARFLAETRVDPVVRMIDHEDNTVWDVLRALMVHRIVTNHLLDAPDPRQGLLDLDIPERQS